MELALQTGDKVSWKIGLENSTLMTGVVMEDLKNGYVDIISHTKNGYPFVLDLVVNKTILTLIY